ncbi:hypothetical protein HFO56_24475 [Rhizobium laguerreae]|uniref:hypothetical protein n=1 Tax=Rhizobium laguerreae TaxID=1076926 RepID=UPI001C90FC01|nr:hypothetical protein [Rhizobium laguerreae]MBY3155487.1 hypothetical protein [Rhizobium laguerreae]
MILEIPIRYRASGRRKGNSINSTLPFQEKIAVEIEVLSDEEAPVVADWDDTPPEGLSPHGNGWTILPGGEREHVRSFEDAFWRPLRRYEVIPDADAHPISVGEFVRATEDGTHTAGFPPVELTGRKFFGAAEYFETVDFSDRAKYAGSVEAAARDIVLVDGVVYQRCPEPMIVQRTMLFDRESAALGGRVGHMGEVLRIVNRPPTDPSPTATAIYRSFSSAETYPLHMFKEALSRTRRQNAANRRTKDMLNEFNARRQPTLSGDYFLDGYNAKPAECAIKLRQFLVVVAENREVMLPLSDTRKIRLFCDLSDALADMPSDRAMDVIERAGREYLDHYDVGRENSHLELVVLKKAMKAAAERSIDLPMGTRVSTEPTVRR